jgi:hypothetical protein
MRGRLMSYLDLTIQASRPVVADLQRVTDRRERQVITAIRSGEKNLD